MTVPTTWPGERPGGRGVRWGLAVGLVSFITLLPTAVVAGAVRSGPSSTDVTSTTAASTSATTGAGRTTTSQPTTTTTQPAATTTTPQSTTTTTTPQQATTTTQPAASRPAIVRPTTTTTQPVTPNDCGSNPASIPPVGLPIDTLSNNPAGAIVINGLPLPRTADPGGIHIAVIDRKTGAAVLCETEPRTVVGVQQLQGIVNDYAGRNPEGYLTVLSGSEGLFESGAFDGLSQLATQLGVPPLTNADRQWLVAQRPFSFIGSNGWQSGWGYSDLGGTGSLSGYLQTNPGSGALGFTFGDFPSFNTSAASTPNSNTIQLGSQMISTGSLHAAYSGFQIVIADRRTLNVLKSTTIFTNCPFPGCDAAYQRNLVQFLDTPGLYNSNDLVIFQSFNHPNATTLAWNDIANRITDLGGTRGLFNTLDGTKSYALVTVPGVPNSTVESITDSVTGENGTIAGTLGRDHLDGFLPSLDQSSAGVTGGSAILQLAYQPPSAWPLRASAADRAAIAYIAQQLGFGVSDPNQVYTSLTTDFGDKANQLRVLPFAGGGPFTEADFSAVKAELLQEFGWVGAVHRYFAQVRTILTESVLLNQGTLTDYAKTVADGVGLNLDKNNPSVSVSAFNIYEQLFGLAKALGVPGAGIVAGTFKVLGVVFPQKNVDVLGSFTSNFKALGADIAARYRAALPAIGRTSDILVTDYSKLRTAGGNIETDQPGWNWDADSVSRLERDIDVSVRRVFAGSLLSAVYNTFRLPSEFPNASTCHILFGEPASAWIVHLNDFRAAGSGIAPDTQAWAIGLRSRQSFVGGSRANADLTDPLFKPVSPDFSDRLGLSKIYFLERVLTQVPLSFQECAGPSR